MSSTGSPGRLIMIVFFARDTGLTVRFSHPQPASYAVGLRGRSRWAGGSSKSAMLTRYRTRLHSRGAMPVPRLCWYS